jgi:glycerol-3-phosphate dehydrogenase
MTPRETLLDRLESRRFDVLIIGGGIVGAGIARDAAMRGLTVALIEQGDFASGASSRTSKLIHGGLRYLEHGRLRLVFESLRERKALLAIAPAYVHPMSLLLPVYQGDARSAWKVHLGLWLYDLLAWGRTIRSHRMVSARRALALEPGLCLEGLRAAGLYADAQMDDARLCLSNILQAVSFGAVCCNYVQLRALSKANQRICGGVGEDVLTGRAIEIQAQVVVNATGPWADRVRALSDAGAPQRMAPTKGSHLVLPRIAQEALFVQGRADGRMLFLLPWGEYSLVGTTEAAVDDPLDVLAASADEVGYLLEEVNRVLPGSHVDEEDVVATYAGARPLLAFSGASTKASREHRIEVDRWGLVSVMGGKFTTYRRMAQQAVDFLIERARWKMDRCLTNQVGLLETIQPVALSHWQEITRAMDPDLLARLLSRYGAGTFHLLRLLEREPTLAHPICPHHEVIEAELVHAVQQELACTITDVLARRTRIAWSSCQGLDALSTLIELFQHHAGPSQPSIERQVEEYHQFLARGLAFRHAQQLSSASFP